MALRYITLEANTSTMVCAELITEGSKIDAMIRRTSENKGWSVEEVNNYLDAGKTLYVRSDQFIYQLYYTHAEH